MIYRSKILKINDLWVMINIILEQKDELFDSNLIKIQKEEH